MKDPRHAKLAELLVRHSSRVEKGDRVLIEAFDIPHEFTVELIRAYFTLTDVAAAQTVFREVDDLLRWRPDLGILGCQASQLRSQLDQVRGNVIGAARNAASVGATGEFLIASLSVGAGWVGTTAAAPFSSRLSRDISGS